MGLIKTAVLVGGGGYALNRAAKTYAEHDERKYAAHPPMPVQQGQAGGQRAIMTDGYRHQSFCNGSCGGSCTDGYLHQAYCNGSCNNRCNGAGTGAPPAARAQAQAGPSQPARGYIESEQMRGGQAAPWESQPSKAFDGSYAPPEYAR